MTERAATARVLGADQTDAEPVQDPRRHRVGGGCGGGLHAAVEHQHLARMTDDGPRRRRLHRRYFFAHHGRQQRPQRAADTQQHGEAPWIRNQRTQHASLHAFSQRARHFFLHHRPADIHQPAVTHPRRTSGFTGTAGETAVEMQLGLRGDRAALQHLFDEINAAARTVELIAEQLIGGTSGGAKTAVHARAQDGIRLPTFGRVFQRIAE